MLTELVVYTNIKILLNYDRWIQAQISNNLLSMFKE